MPDYVEDQEIYGVMTQLAECTRLEIVNSGLVEIDNVMLQPSNLPVVDFAGNGKVCGQIVVNLNNAVPIAGFPNQDSLGTCSSEFADEIALWVFRCAPPVKGTKQAPIFPSPADQTNAARDQLADKAAMLRAIRCCMQKSERQYLIRNYQPYGPAGNTVGGVWTIFVGPKK